MKEIKINTSVKLYQDVSELPDLIQTLFERAEKARDKAYAPYSEYQVGAALQLESGKIVTGSNQENASYPSGLCAERTAIYYAGSQYPEERITALVITVKSLKKEVDSPAAPCGACRQSILEYEVKQEKGIPIYFRGETGSIAKVDSVSDILPLAFSNKSL